MSYPSDQFKIENGNFVILPSLKSSAKSLCQKIPLIWRKDQALNELVEKKKIPPEMFGDLHKNFEGALNQLKADARTVMSDIDRQINKCTMQIQELHSALINLEIEREIGRIDAESYQKALGMIQWGLKGANAERSDLEALKSKLSNMLLEEKTLKTPESTQETTPESTQETATESTQEETQEATVPASPGLPEPPVVVHVKNTNE